MTAKQRISAAFMLLSAPYLFLTACDSAEQKAQNAKWEEQASFNAVAYIQNKYGFTAEVTEANVDRKQGWISTQPLSDVFVDMTCEGRAFTVFITGEQASDAGADNYQAAEIEQAVFDTVNADIPGLQVLDLYAVRKCERRYDMALYETKFDGSNLAEVVTGSIASMQCFYQDTDLSQKKDFAALEKLFGKQCGIKTEFFSCRNADVFSIDKIQRNWCASHPVYCKQFRSLAYSDGDTVIPSEYQSYDLRKYGDFYYTVSYDKDQKEKSDPVFQEVTPVDPAVFNGRGVKGAEIASKTYQLTADVPMKVKIYFPCSVIENFDYDGYMHSKTKFGRCTRGDGEQRDQADSVTLVGEYAYEELSLREGIEITFEYLYDPD